MYTVVYTPDERVCACACTCLLFLLWTTAFFYCDGPLNCSYIGFVIIIFLDLVRIKFCTLVVNKLSIYLSVCWECKAEMFRLIN